MNKCSNKMRLKKEFFRHFLFTGSTERKLFMQKHTALNAFCSFCDYHRLNFAAEKFTSHKQRCFHVTLLWMYVVRIFYPLQPNWLRHIDKTMHMQSVCENDNIKMQNTWHEPYWTERASLSPFSRCNSCRLHLFTS